MTAYWKKIHARARIEVNFYVTTKHYGVSYLKVFKGSQRRDRRPGGWSEMTVDDMVKTYGHSADERRLDDIDAHFAADAAEVEA